jgi:hypothetical protein
MPLFLFFSSKRRHIKSMILNTVAMLSLKRDSIPGLLFLRRMRCPLRLRHSAKHSVYLFSFKNLYFFSSNLLLQYVLHKSQATASHYTNTQHITPLSGIRTHDLLFLESRCWPRRQGLLVNFYIVYRNIAEGSLEGRRIASRDALIA